MSGARRIDLLGLSVRTTAALTQAGITTDVELAKANPVRLLDLPNLSRLCLDELVDRELIGQAARARVRGGGAGAGVGRAPAVVEGDDPQTAAFRAVNYYPTPPWAARAGGELVRRLDPSARTACEPACGGGHMAHGLADYFDQVTASDLYPHGFGRVADFLDDPTVGAGADWIVTNPPFSLSGAFVAVALTRARRGVAILQRLTWIETDERFDLFNGRRPLTILAPFAERVPMQLGSWDPNGSTATPYGWFVWMADDIAAASPEPAARAAVALRSWVGLAIPAGQRKRLSRASDLKFAGV